MSQNTIELETIGSSPAAPQDIVVTQHLRQEFSLPPADSSKDAWLFLAACWAVEALVWGRLG